MGWIVISFCKHRATWMLASRDADAANWVAVRTARSITGSRMGGATLRRDALTDWTTVPLLRSARCCSASPRLSTVPSFFSLTFFLACSAAVPPDAVEEADAPPSGGRSCCGAARLTIPGAEAKRESGSVAEERKEK